MQAFVDRFRYKQSKARQAQSRIKMIAKLEKMLGPFTSDPQLRLSLALALKVHQMKGI